MKKTAKRLLSLLLALCLLTALASYAFADGKKYEKYLMIGDSIGIYCGVPEGVAYTAVYTHPDRTFAGSYSERLKNDSSLGIRSICSCAHPGWRVQEALYALGGVNRTADYILTYAGDTAARMQQYSPVYAKALEEADLITVNLGFNNIMQPFVYGLYTAFEKDGVAFSGSKTDQKILECLNRLKADCGDTEALVTLISVLETTERGLVLLKNALKMLPDSVREFKKSWEELTEHIYTVNPDADVLVLSMYNPVDDIIKYAVNSALPSAGALGAITDATAWLLKEATDPVNDAFNQVLRSGSRYSQNYVFVDIRNVDLVGSKDGVHLGDVGHQYVYTQIKNAITTHFVSGSVPATKTTAAGFLGKLFSDIKNLF